MKVYFGEINYDADEAFEFEGTEYDFVLKVTEEQVVIKDAIGRYMPMEHGAALELLQALKLMKPELKALAEVQNAKDRIENSGDFAI